METGCTYDWRRKWHPVHKTTFAQVERESYFPKKKIVNRRDQVNLESLYLINLNVTVVPHESSADQSCIVVFSFDTFRVLQLCILHCGMLHVPGSNEMDVCELAHFSCHNERLVYKVLFPEV